MAKYTSTAAYRQTDALNKAIKAVWNGFGPDSEVYQMYVNKLTAVLPAGSVYVSPSGFIQVSKSKNAGVTAAQVKKARKGLPTYRQAKQTYKRQVAEEKLIIEGRTTTETNIQKYAKTVTDEEVQRYVDAKSFVRAMEDSRGKLMYDASVADLMATQGAKSYELLRAILEEGETRANAETQKEATNAAAVEGGYEANRANVESQRARL